MKVIVWGCGSFGKQIFPNLMMSGKYEVVAYTDNKEELWGRHFQWVPIIAPEQIMGKEFDILLIVVSSPSATEEIKAQLMKLGAPQDKVANAFTDFRFMELFVDQKICFIRGYADWAESAKMEGNVAEAKRREADFKNREARRESFLRRQWKRSKRGNEYLKIDGHLAVLCREEKDKWKYSIDNEFCQVGYDTREEVLQGVFRALEALRRKRT